MPHRHRVGRNQAGKATGGLVVLLLLVTVGGGWNYHRNLQLEKATEGDRPYRSYATADLEALRAAYASELESVRASFDSAKRRRARPSGDVGSIAGNVEQFQQTTRASTAIRDAAASVARSEDQVSDLDRELELRAQFGAGWSRHLRLLTTI